MSSMFCFQCQEAVKGTGCTIQGVRRITSDIANLQDLLLYTLKGISIFSMKGRELGVKDSSSERFITESMFATITNADFEREDFIVKVREGIALRNKWKARFGEFEAAIPFAKHDAALWTPGTDAELEAKAATVGVLSTADEDLRSLRELLTYRLKGMAAYLQHATVLGYREYGVIGFMEKGLLATLNDDMGVQELIALVMECGKFGVDVMLLLDQANTTTYGNLEITEVNMGLGSRPGILISGHDLRDMEALLKQTEDTGSMCIHIARSYQYTIIRPSRSTGTS